MDHFYIITGGPGTGKTAVIEELEKRGYRCVPETGRAVIQQQMQAGGTALPWKDRQKFAMMMFEQSLANFEVGKQINAALWFDRGIVDVAGYLELCELPIPETISRAIREHRYNSNVFITPPWKEIYRNDTERKQSFEEAVATYEVMRKVYSRNGYQLIELPKSSVSARVEFMLNHLRHISQHK